MLYVSIIAAVIVLSILVAVFRRGWWSHLHRKIVGWTVILYGIYLATLTGSYTSLVLPEAGSIAIGAGTGAVTGYVTWLIIGTVGVATGGVGVAVGAGAMAAIGAFFGGAGGAAGGFGLETVTYPLISPIFWVPVILLGIYFLIGAKIKMQQRLPSPKKENIEHNT